MPFCNKCGEAYSEDDRFCPKCGVQIPSEKKKDKSRPLHKSRPLPLWRRLSIGVAVVLLLFIGYQVYLEYYSPTSPPSSGSAQPTYTEPICVTGTESGECDKCTSPSDCQTVCYALCQEGGFDLKYADGFVGKSGILGLKKTIECVCTCEKCS